MVDLRVGTFLAPRLMPMYLAITHYVGEQLGLSTELFVEDDYSSCLKDEHEMCFVCSLPYVSFERDGVAPAVPIAAPVIEGDRYGDLPIYYSDVIVGRNSSAGSFLDLRGRSWAYNEPLSQSGYGIVRHHLLRIGETNGFFGTVVESGFHEESIRMVVAGTVDATAIDSHVLAVALRDDPELGEAIRIIDVLGPSTIQPVAVSKRLPLKLQWEIRRALLSMHENAPGREALHHGLVDRFVSVGIGNYNDIRTMLEECEDAGFMVLR